MSEEYVREAMETLRELGGQEDEISGEGRNKMWKMLKQMHPKVSPAVPVGKQEYNYQPRKPEALVPEHVHK